MRIMLYNGSEVRCDLLTFAFLWVMILESTEQTTYSTVLLSESVEIFDLITSYIPDLSVCVCVCCVCVVGMFMWFMRTQICIMTWV